MAHQEPGRVSAHPEILTVEQRQWLSAPGRVVRIGVTSIPPQVFCNPDTGELSGMCIDFIRELEEILEYHFELVYFPTWNEMMGAAFLRHIDVVYAAQKTPSREELFLFSDSYLRFENKIVTTEDISGPLTLNDLADKRVTVVSGAAIEEHLRLNYPDIQLVEVDDELIGLTRVSFNQADAMVIEIARASWYIQQNKFTNLHITGDAGYVYELGFACRNDQPELVTILNTGLGQISRVRRSELINRWILPAERRGPDLTVLLIVVGGSALALLAAFGWNRLLSLQVRHRTAELERELIEHQKDISALRRYETIISLSDDMMAFADSSYVYRAVNDAYLKAVDKTREDVIGHTIDEVLGPDYYGLPISEQMKKSFGGETVDFECWVELKTLGSRYVQGVYLPYKNTDGVTEGVVIVIHDITDIQVARQEVLNREEQLRSLFVASPVGIGITKDRVILSINDRVCDISGYSEEELVGQNARMLYLSDEDYQYVGNEKYRQIELCGVGTVETRWRRKDGRIIDVLLSSAPMDRAHREKGVSFTVMDITGRKQAELALRESEEKYRTLIDQAAEMLFFHDLDGNLVDVNQAAIKATGYSRDELLRMKVYDIDPDAEHRHDKRHVWESLSGTGSKAFEVRHRRKDGTLYWAEVRAGKLAFRGGEYILALVNDITERKQAEESRERLLRELRSKNEELESIVFIASHDLRSPLVNIRGFAGEMEKSVDEIRSLLSDSDICDALRQKLENPLNQDVPESLHFIKSSSQKMETLLNGLLRLSRIGTAQINPVSINMDQLAGGIIGGLGFKIREHNIDILVEGALPGCRGDITLINQVFVNLVDNSIKYRHPERPCRIRIRGRAAGDRSVYEVEDNGIGIAAEHKEKVFEIFHQLNPGAGGDGLGLTIVRRVLERQDGTIGIESEVGGGTLVSVTLPIA